MVWIKRKRHCGRLRFRRWYFWYFHSRNRWWGFEVKATNGDTFLGGDDFDQKILHWLIDNSKKKTVSIFLKIPKLFSVFVKRLKKLKSNFQVRSKPISIFLLLPKRRPTSPFNHQNDPGRIGNLCDDFNSKNISPVEKCLKDAGVTKADIAEVVMVAVWPVCPKFWKC